MRNRLASYLLTFAALSTLMFGGADWPRFRGPDGTGLAPNEAAPVEWSASEGVLWKTPMPGPGSSSPIVIGNRVFLTCYSGYGLSKEDPGQPNNLKHHLVCVGLADGKILWDQATKADLPEKAYDSGFIYLHGYASGTPTSDGKAVYGFFGRSGVFAYTLDGQPIWKASVGEGTHSWGSGASPILCGDLLIVNASVESESIVALNKADGKEVWRTPGIHESWSTPAVVTLADGSRELVVSMKNKVLGLDPATGKELWECKSVRDYVCPAVVARDGIVYVSGGRSPYTLAIRAGGRGDVTETHKVWDARKATKVPTPLWHDGRLFWLDQKGIVTCLDAASGEIVYQQRLRFKGTGDKIYASLVAAGNHLYGVTREDGTVVLAAGPKFEQLGHNHLDDDSIFNSTPAVVDGHLVIRSDRFLYCLGK